MFAKAVAVELEVAVLDEDPVILLVKAPLLLILLLV